MCTAFTSSVLPPLSPRRIRAEGSPYDRFGLHLESGRRAAADRPRSAHGARVPPGPRTHAGGQCHLSPPWVGAAILALSGTPALPRHAHHSLLHVVPVPPPARCVARHPSP